MSVDILVVIVIRTEVWYKRKMEINERHSTDNRVSTGFSTTGQTFRISVTVIFHWLEYVTTTVEYIRIY